MRGRLIIPFWAELAQLDIAATRAAGGYDDVWRTTKSTYAGGVVTSKRVEKATIRLPCQVEVGSHGRQVQTAGGNLPDSRFQLVFHFKDLEDAGLVDVATGNPLLVVDDRLVAIYDRSGALTQTFPNPPGLFATEVQPREYGLGSKRNLLLITYEDRPQGRST